MQIKVLHLISTLDVGGAEQNLFRLVTSMDKGAYENIVVCMTAPGIMGRRIEQAGIPVHSLKMRKGTPEISAAFRLRFTANIFKPDIIQCWMYHANVMGLTISRRYPILWNIRCSDMDLTQYGLVYRFAVMAGARLSGIPQMVVSNSFAGMEAHKRLGYHPRKWVIIPNGFDTMTFKTDPDARSLIRADLGIPNDALTLGLIGRFDPMKDHATFFSAATLFSKSHPDTHFIIAGKGITDQNPTIRGYLGAAPDPEKFHLLGERDDIPYILASLDIATSSSSSEGLPNAIGEAMACGIPCVATDAGDTGLLLGDTGLLVSRRSPRNLCVAWERLAQMGPEARGEMGSRARERIMQFYSQDRATRSYEKLYQEIIESQ
ncbi:MAG TPA: glycosyltransferase [Desulfomonilia bacterium]|nr:glycosyltransferase [Desulfomonilia bacterium]